MFDPQIVALLLLFYHGMPIAIATVSIIAFTTSCVAKDEPFIPNFLINSRYCLPYSSHDVNSENLVLDQLTIAQLIFLFILITCLLDIVLIL